MRKRCSASNTLLLEVRPRELFGKVRKAMYTVKRLPRWREAELDEEYAAKGEHCNICKRPIVKWVQIGSGWASGYYEHCLGCASTHFRKAHNHCVPLCVKDYGWANKIACYLRKDCKDNELLVAQCEYCVGNVAQSG